MTPRNVFGSWLFVLGVLLFPWQPAKADTHVAIISSANAHALEQLAARELESQFQRLFVNIHTSLSHQPTSEAQLLVLVGSPQTNPHVKRAIGKSWPDISDQGLVIKSVSLDGQQTLVVGGASPVATLWAVYELGQRYGVRYLLRDDVYPQKKVPLAVADLDITLEPRLRSRTWRTVNDFAMGPESWGLADHQRVLRQLAKLKFNHILISLWPWQPFVHYEFGV